MQTRSGGVEIHFEVHGAGPPVMLVHGYPLSGALWDDVVPHLASEYRVIVPDLRGHGRSEPTERVTMEEMADDLLAVLDAADEERPVVLVGMSMGGYVALAFCRRHPERVRGLALVDSRASADGPEAAEKRRATAAQVLEAGTAEDVAEEMAGKLFADGADPGLRARWRESMAATSPTGVAAALRAMADRPDSTAFLRRSDLPLLVTVGSEDGITPPDEARKLAANVGATLEVIDGAGHAAPAERPREVAEALRRFLEEVG